ARVGSAFRYGRHAVNARTFLALWLAVGGVVLSGCGSSGGGSSSSPTAASPPAARFVVGRWHGQLHQRGMAPFRIAVTVGSLSNSRANWVHYTGIDCGGHWTYLGTSGSTVRFREVIESGKSKTCKGVGQVTLTRDGARLRYRFAGG